MLETAGGWLCRISQKWWSSPSLVHFVSLTHHCWNQSNYFKSVKWSVCDLALCRVLLFMLQVNLQVQCCFESGSFKSGFHSEQKLTWRWCSECPELNAASPALLTHQWFHYSGLSVERKAVRIIYISVYFPLRCQKHCIKTIYIYIKADDYSLYEPYGECCLKISSYQLVKIFIFKLFCDHHKARIACHKWKRFFLLSKLFQL